MKLNEVKDLVTTAVQEVLCGKVGLYYYIICISLNCPVLPTVLKDSEKYSKVLPRIACSNCCKIYTLASSVQKICSLFNDHFEAISKFIHNVCGIISQL